MEALAGQLSIIAWIIGAGVLYWLYTFIEFDNRTARMLIWVVAIAWAFYGGTGSLDDTVASLLGCSEGSDGYLTCK